MEDGSLSMFIEYGHLNKVTIKKTYPIPKIDYLFNQLYSDSNFSKRVLRFRYHKLRVRNSDIPKITYKSRYGHYEFVFMSFGLSNAHATFMDLMKRVFN